jgi:hypothetical protein
MSPTTVMNTPSEKPLPIGSSESARKDVEQKLRAAAQRFKENHNPEDLKEAHRRALRMLVHGPDRTHEVLPLPKELIPPSRQQRPSI